MVVSTTICFDEKLYEADVLQKSAYRSMNNLVLDITQVGGQFQCVLTPCKDVSESAFTQAVEDFRKDVLDYQLRKKLSAETVDVRNLIIGIAFSKTGMVD